MELEDLAREVITRLADTPGALRQAVIDAMWARIPSTVAEGICITATNGQVVNINRQTDELERIESVTAICPAGGATLSLGNDQRWSAIPLVQGVNQLGPALHIVLSPSDVRSVKAGGAGALFVLLSGEQMPTTGNEAP